MKWLTRSQCLFAGLILVLSSTLWSSVEASSSPTASPLKWHACDQTFECATLLVPADYGNPSSGNLHLALVMAPATSKHPLGDILTNPGGPGESGVQFLEANVSTFPKKLRQRFNIVSWDPRGIGASSAVSCGSVKEIEQFGSANPDPTGLTQIQDLHAFYRSFVESCQQHTPKALLDHVATIDTVHDLDVIRQALGQAKLNYIGFSYGTVIGELYAETFPQRIRTMVLDGVFDPAMSETEANVQQTTGFEGQLRAFFRWCNTDTTCRHQLPHGAHSALNAFFAELRSGRTFTVSSAPGGPQRLNLGLAEYGVIVTLYSQQSWPVLAEALHDAVHGHVKYILELADLYLGLFPPSQSSNMTAANVAINCEDFPTTLSDAQMSRLAQTLNARAPLLGGSVVWSSLVCEPWPVRPTLRVAPVHAPAAPPVLVIGSTGDPATPYVQSVDVAHQFPRAVLLTRDGNGHTAYPYSSCVRHWTDRYFISRRLPPSGTVCQSN